MLLAGERVHPLWQGRRGCLFVPGRGHLHVVRMRRRNPHGCAARVYRRAIDMEVLDEGCRASTSWTYFRLAGMGRLPRHPLFRGAFVPPSTSIVSRAVFSVGDVDDSIRRLDAAPLLADPRNTKHVFGLRPQFGRRHDLSLQPHDIWRFGPIPSRCISSAIEVLVSLGFILHGRGGISSHRQALWHSPAPLQEWHDMASYFRFRRPYIRWTGYFKYGQLRRRRIARLRLTSKDFMAKRITMTRSPELKATFASTSKWTTTQSAMHGLRAPCGAASKRFCADATHAMPGCHPAFLRVCTTVHAMASVRAVEDALKLRFSAQRPVHPQSHPDCARAARPHCSTF